MCLNLSFEARKQLTFYKVSGLNTIFVIQYIQCFKNFWGSAMFLYKVLLKWGKNEEDFESSIFFEAQKYYFCFWIEP